MAAVIYIHGFLSSPESHKAKVTEAWLKKHRREYRYHCPFLTPCPKATQNTLEALLHACAVEPVYLMGSSLGGFWATHLVERYASQYTQLRAVLVNPSINPALAAAELVGQRLKNYHSDDEYTLTAQSVEHLATLKRTTPKHKARYWLLVQTEDEVLDYALAVKFYTGCKQTVEPGGSHGFEGFEQHLPNIFGFFEQSLSNESPNASISSNNVKI